jgi:hypothetical protein
VEALGERAAVRGEELELRGLLDALGDRREVERVRELHDRDDDRGRARIARDAAQERAVDLQRAGSVSAPAAGTDSAAWKRTVPRPSRLAS